MLKGFTHARLACGCRLAFRVGVEGSPVTVVVDVKMRRDCADDVRSALPGARLWTLAEPEDAPWAIQHSKVITVDDRASLVTSANFSDAAVSRSLECGLLDRDASTAGALRRHFDLMYTSKILVDYEG